MNEGPITDRQAVDAVPDVEGSFVYQYVKWAKPQTDAPIAYHLLAALTLLAVSCPTNMGMPFAGPPLRATLFGLLTGRSGEDRKSTAVAIATDLLSKSVPDLLGREPGTEPGLVDGLAIQPTQLIPYSEFGHFLKKAEQQGYYGDIKTRYNMLFDGTAVSRTKANGKGVHIENPRVSILAACARDYLEAHTTPVDWSGGFMGRWLIMYAHRERLLATGAAPNERKRKKLGDFLLDRSATGFAGLCGGFDGEAAKVWANWFTDINGRQLPALIVGARARVPTFAAKIAMLLAWDYGEAAESDEGTTWRVTTEQLIPAIAIAELHLQSVCHIAATLSESKDMRDRRKVLDVLTVSPVPLKLGEIIGASRLLKRRVAEVVETLAEESIVAAVRSSDGSLRWWLRAKLTED